MIKLLIKVKPNSAKDEISVDAEGNLTVKIRAKPIDGEANEYLIKYLAKEFDISQSLIQIEKGTTGRHKRIALNIELQKLEEFVKNHKK
ncbi:MAG TPA: DUF167 domain-containing protein [Bacteroidia bacterium]|jgi:uncharacterized protein (TIGR00251 family)|nr:DUF167 domain-containing protein [Bacteroidia bacterium]